MFFSCSKALVKSMHSSKKPLWYPPPGFPSLPFSNKETHLDMVDYRLLSCTREYMQCICCKWMHVLVWSWYFFTISLAFQLSILWTLELPDSNGLFWFSGAWTGLAASCKHEPLCLTINIGSASNFSRIWWLFSSSICLNILIHALFKWTNSISSRVCHDLQLRSS